MSLNDEILKLIEIEESDEKRFLSPPLERVKKNEKVLGTLNKREVAILSALKKAEHDLWGLKLKLVNPQNSLSYQKLNFQEQIVFRLKKILFANLIYRFKIEEVNASYSIKKDWQLVTDAL